MDSLYYGISSCVSLCRVYEKREMRFHQEKKDKLKAFDNDIDRLKNELEYLKSEDKQSEFDISSIYRRLKALAYGVISQ